MTTWGNLNPVHCRSRSHRGRGLRCAALATASVMLAAAGMGCTRSGRSMAKDQQQAAQDTDVYRVVCFFPPNTWKSFDEEGDLNPEGFSFVMYLISRKSNKGVFADGTFHVEIYERGEVNASGRRPRHLVFETSAPMEDLPRRSRTMLGVGYQPAVYWGDLDIYGHDIEVVVKYESPTGRIVPSETVSLKVPDRKV